MRHGQAAQQDLVGDGKDGGVGADAKSQRDQADGSEARPLAQLAQAVADILEEILDEADAAFVAAFLLEVFDGAESAQGGSVGGLRLHAGGEVLLDLLVEMEAKLMVELVFDQGPPEKRPQTDKRLHNQSHGLCSFSMLLSRQR